MRILIYTDDPGLGGTAVTSALLAGGVQRRRVWVDGACRKTATGVLPGDLREVTGLVNHWVDCDTRICTKKTTFSLHESTYIVGATCFGVVLFGDGRLVSNIGTVEDSVLVLTARDLSYRAAMDLSVPTLPGTLRDVLLHVLCCAEEWAQDLSPPHPLDDPEVTDRILGWWVLMRRSRFSDRAAPSMARGVVAIIAEPVATVTKSRLPAIPLMRVLRWAHLNVAEAFDPHANDGVRGLVTRFYCIRTAEHALQDLIKPDEWSALLAPAFPDHLDDGRPALAVHIWHNRPDLQATLDITALDRSMGLARWFFFNLGRRHTRFGQRRKHRPADDATIPWQGAASSVFVAGGAGLVGGHTWALACTGYRSASSENPSSGVHDTFKWGPGGRRTWKTGRVWPRWSSATSLRTCCSLLPSSRPALWRVLPPTPSTRSPSRRPLPPTESRGKAVPPAARQEGDGRRGNHGCKWVY